MAAGDTKLIYGTVVSLTVTALNGLASSATAGWQSAVQDNTSNLYLDALVQVIVDMANTAPANSKALFVYAYAGLETSYTNPASGSEGTITLVDITANAQNLKLLGTIPYTTADEVIESAPFSVAAAFGGVLPPKWGIVIINHTGAAIAPSGNTVKWTPVYYNTAAA
jgi:hypothetical protein